MLEILALVFLCRKIKVIAYERKRKAGGFIALTIFLWFFGEVVGAFIVRTVADGIIIYVSAILGAVIGAVVSYLIVKNFPIGTYEVPKKPIDVKSVHPEARELPEPYEIKIIREKSLSGSYTAYTMIFNGEEFYINNGDEVVVKSSVDKNVIRFKGDLINSYEMKPLYFSVIPGQTAEIHIKPWKFAHKKHKGIEKLPVPKRRKKA